MFHISNDTVTGPNGISSLMPHQTAHNILFPLSLISNSSITTGTFHLIMTRKKTRMFLLFPNLVFVWGFLLKLLIVHTNILVFILRC